METFHEGTVFTALGLSGKDIMEHFLLSRISLDRPMISGSFEQ